MEQVIVEDLHTADIVLERTLSGEVLLVEATQFYPVLRLVAKVSPQSIVVQPEDPINIQAVADIYALHLIRHNQSGLVSEARMEELKQLELDNPESAVFSFIYILESKLSHSAALVLYRLLQAGVKADDAGLFSLLLDYGTTRMFLTDLTGVDRERWHQAPSDLETYWLNWNDLPPSDETGLIMILYAPVLLDVKGAAGDNSKLLDLPEALRITNNVYHRRRINRLGYKVYNSVSRGKLVLSRMSVSTMWRDDPISLIPLIVEDGVITSSLV